MVSVIIPVYNVENYLAACLDSVLQQTYRDLEILLIDDGSTDQSGNICLEYAARDERILYLKTGNKGAADARNLALQICTGEYVAFVDSDDRIHPQAIELMLRAIRENNVPLVKADYDRIPDGGNPPFTRLEYESIAICTLDCWTEIKNSFVRPFIRAVWGALYTKNSLEGLLFEPGNSSEDTMYSCRLLVQNQRLVRIEAPLYQYRARNESIVTHTIAGKNDLDALDAGRQLIDFLSNVKPEFVELAKAEFFSECIDRENRFLHNGCDSRYEEELSQYIDVCAKALQIQLQSLLNADIPARRRLLCLAGRISFPAACRLKYWITSILNR